MEEENDYSKDGTVDYLGNPANRKKTGTWKACPFILGNECCERLAYYGMSTNLVLYFKERLHQHSAVASKNVSNWAGTCYITPLIGGAFVADSYLGRYWTIASLSILYVIVRNDTIDIICIRMTLLTLSASVSGVKPECQGKDNCHATNLQSAVCFLALYLIALGTGGIKPCVSSYGADQFDDDDNEDEKKHKSSFFNWFYFSINIGALIASSLLVLDSRQHRFFSGNKLYRNQRPGGSPLTRIAQVIIASTIKYHVDAPTDKSLLYEIADTESAIKGKPQA
ncbi:hypothetical protein OROHE_002983 [Orobanche hederae]